MLRDDPVIIGGTGGSGTSVFAKMMEVLGLDIGQFEKPKQSEWRPFSKFVTGRGLEIFGGDPKALARAQNDLKSVLELHQAQTGSGPWGMKAPQSCMIVAFLAACLPNMRFIHVVRDGRDMALSTNQTQANKYGELLLRDMGATSGPLRSIKSWNEINCWVLEEGQALLGDRFHVVRFEDLMAGPRETLTRASAFAHLTPTDDQINSAVALLKPFKPGVGRSLDLPAVELQAITEAAHAGLRAFGYL